MNQETETKFMSKLKVLFVGESVLLNTGYAVYAREIMSRLYQSGKVELAEMACYIEPEDKRLAGIPWKVYPVIPPKNTEAHKRYDELKGTVAQFGAGSFERIALDFKPNIVIGIRDFWMDSFLDTSPFRLKYKLFLMPTVDSYPQNEQWLSLYSNCDKIFTYQDWSKEVLENEGGNKINICESTPPAANPIFCPQDIYSRLELKKKFGLVGKNVIGTVMRNQPRKLFPALFESFRQYIDESGDKNTVLYCHTSYPDNGWDLPKYLVKYGLSSRVYFSYVCRNESCKHFFPTTFMDACTVCPKCKNGSLTPVNVNNGINNEILSDIYNLFDLYVQYSNLEGFGVPLVEAAACGTPVAGTDFSAMVDVVRKLKGFPIKVLSAPYEMSTGRKMSIPDNNDFVKILHKFSELSEENKNELRFTTRNAYDKHYSWDRTAATWLRHILEYEMSLESLDKLWYTKEDLREIPARPDDKVPLTNSQYARWLITEVLGQQDKVGSYMETRLIRDLNYGQAVQPLNENYSNEDSAGDKIKYIKFDRQDAYNSFVNLRNNINYWEKQRGAQHKI